MSSEILKTTVQNLQFCHRWLEQDGDDVELVAKASRESWVFEYSVIHLISEVLSVIYYMPDIVLYGKDLLLKETWFLSVVQKWEH